MQSEIPDDVMKAARASTVAYFNSFGADAEADAVSNKDRDHWGEVQSAAWAIMAERERCKAALSAAEPSVAVKALQDAFKHFKVVYDPPKGVSINEATRRKAIEVASSALTAQVQDVAGTVEMVENCVLFSTPGEYAGLADHAAFEAGQDNAIRTVVKLLRDNLPAAPSKQEGQP